jgi:hypothetical protein
LTYFFFGLVAVAFLRQSPYIPAAAIIIVIVFSKLIFKQLNAKKLIFTVPAVVVGLFVFVIWDISASDVESKQPAQAGTTNQGSPVYDGGYSEYPCRVGEAVSAIDHRTCRPKPQKPTTPVDWPYHETDALPVPQIHTHDYEHVPFPMEFCADVLTNMYCSHEPNAHCPEGKDWHRLDVHKRAETFCKDRGVNGARPQPKAASAGCEDLPQDKQAECEDLAKCLATGGCKTKEDPETPLAERLPHTWRHLSGNSNSAPLSVWIAGNNLYEVSANEITLKDGITRVDDNMSCTTTREDSEWDGTCTYSWTWTKLDNTSTSQGRTVLGSCKLETDEHVTDVSETHISGQSQRVDYTPLKEQKCPVPSSDYIGFEYVPINAGR